MTAPAKRARPSKINPWIVAFIVSIATFMEVLDVSIANVALRHIAGSMGASYDQATWILTSYLIANAVILPASAWFAQLVGRKKFYMACVTVFTVSSLLCGLSWSLGSLIFFRVLQGLGGGGLAPSEQAILADAFPPEKRGSAFAVYGLAVVVAPTIGPTLGGFITDYSTWHWIFFINIPMGLLSLFLVGTFINDGKNGEAKKRSRKTSLNFDFIGFVLIALCLGALEVVLDEGQRSDWFQSNFIVLFAVISILALAVFIPWELTRRHPLVDLRLLGTRQFGMCFFMMLVTGGTLFSSIQLMPQLVQNEFGYDATLAGLSLSPGGVMTMLMMPIAGYLTDKIQPKISHCLGPDHRRLVDVDPDRSQPRSLVVVRHLDAHVYVGRFAVPVHSDNGGVLCRAQRCANKSSGRADKYREKSRRKHWACNGADVAAATGAVSPKPACRARDTLEYSFSGRYPTRYANIREQPLYGRGRRPSRLRARAANDHQASHPALVYRHVLDPGVALRVCFAADVGVAIHTARQGRAASLKRRTLKSVLRRAPERLAQFLLCYIEGVTAACRQVLACSIDVERQHRHGRLERRALPPSAPFRRMLQRFCNVGCFSLLENARFQIEGIAVARDARRPELGSAFAAFLILSRFAFRPSFPGIVHLRFTICERLRPTWAGGLENSRQFDKVPVRDGLPWNLAC